ncbi:hypothetical protein RGQ29_016027 [Quercus rubra]|uniref:Major facilitator superfamily (MFS) profile domain-containing protein n=1 Tax=Quercus rubra TaxID=3512 RepID=A0AAN7FZ22_QUERU|nr:hypothetical protein RGQ29_016027 [Quercus rubra]
MGAMINLSFNYTPQLIKASFARPHACYIIKSLFQPPSYLFQLQTPVLDIGTEYLVFGSIMTIGAMLGAVLSGRIADILGHRGVSFANSLYMSLGICKDFRCIMFFNSSVLLLQLC